MFPIPSMKKQNRTDPRSYVKELDPNSNLIFYKYSEPEQNQTLITKEHEPNTNPKLWVLSHL